MLSRDEVAGAVTEQHEHGEQPLGLLRVVVQALGEQLQAPLGPQLTDEGPQLGQQLVQVGQPWGGTATSSHSAGGRVCVCVRTHPH